MSNVTPTADPIALETLRLRLDALRHLQVYNRLLISHSDADAAAANRELRSAIKELSFLWAGVTLLADNLDWSWYWDAYWDRVYVEAGTE